MKVKITAALVLGFSQLTWGQVNVVSTFAGDHGPGYKQNPDEAGAVGPSSVVDFNGLDFVVHDKATGAVTFQETQTQFWYSALGNPSVTPATNDPRMLYDPLSQRWFAVMANPSPGNGFLAVSTTSNPAGTWKAVQMPMPAADLGLKIGVDKNGFYASYYNGGTNNATNYSLLAIPKADVIAAAGPVLTNAVTFGNLQAECVPATDLDPTKAANAPEVLLNKIFGGVANQLFLYKVTWAGSTASISTVQTINLPTTYQAPNGSSMQNQATQPSPGVKLRADEGRRTNSVVEFGGNVYGIDGAKATLSSRPGVLWYEVRVSDGALLQEGFTDSATYDLLLPSLAVDSAGNIGIACTQTSATENPSVVVMAHLASGALNSTTAPVVSIAGTTYYRDSIAGAAGASWGNYSTMTVDPSNPNLFWTSQEYANSTVDQQWATGWTSFTVVPEPSCISILAAGGMAMTLRCRRSGVRLFASAAVNLRHRNP